MSNIAIVGDVHIDIKVSSRKDNYFETCLEKISEIARKYKHVIFLGDVFNRPTIPNEYFNKLYTELMYLKTFNQNEFYSIIGNHDIYNENEESLEKTTLGLCNLTNLIKLITVDNPMKIDEINFYTSYVNLNKAKEHLHNLKLNSNDILLLHHYFEDKYDGLVYEDIKDIGCETIFLGHEHTPFSNYNKVCNNITLYRCGSLLRNAANTSNLNRKIAYFGIEDKNIAVKFLDCMKDSELVFTEKAKTRENYNRAKFVKDIKEVIDNYTNNVTTKFSMLDTLKSINTPDIYLQYIESKYNLIGEDLR